MGLDVNATPASERLRRLLLVDFANNYPEDVFPTSEKFWVREGSDLLKILNERGANQK